MDQCSQGNTTIRKRARFESDDSSSDSPKTKLVRVDSVVSVPNSSYPGEIRINSDDSVPDSLEGPVDSLNSPEAKGIQYDLLNILDDSDEPAIQGLDSVIKSFEEEILVGAPAPAREGAESTSHSRGSQPELGYLLEASDDELGLPPTSSASEDKFSAVDFSPATRSEAPIFGVMSEFECDGPRYDSFEFELGGESNSSSGYDISYYDSGDFVALGGLFDCSDDMSGAQWKHAKSLSAL